MNIHERVCLRRCHLRNACPTALQPELPASMIGEHATDGIPRVGVDCRHYSCIAGLNAGLRAYEAAQTCNTWQPYEVITKDGRSETQAVPFGTDHKPADTRIVDIHGTIYSLQDSQFYATGQTIKFPDQPLYDPDIPLYPA